MIKSFMSLRNTVVALGVVALLLAVFTFKLIASEWSGQIGAMQTEQLDQAQCTGSGGGTGPCYGPYICDPATEDCTTCE